MLPVSMHPSWVHLYRGIRQLSKVTVHGQRNPKPNQGIQYRGQGYDRVPHFSQTGSSHSPERLCSSLKKLFRTSVSGGIADHSMAVSHKPLKTKA